MKKLLLLTLICIVSLSLFACTSTGSQSGSNTDTDTSTNTATDEGTSPTPPKDDYTRVENAIQPEYTVKYEAKEYYTSVNYDFGNYVASDLPKEYGDFYKVVKSYEGFVPLVEHGNLIDESVFEESNMLLIYRNYGGRYSIDMGFSSFKYEGGHAYIDLYEYTGNMEYPDANFSNITYLLIPKNIRCYEKEFAPIGISKTMVYSYAYDSVDIENIDLGSRAIIFTNTEDYEAFEHEYGINAFYSGACIIIPKLSDSVASYGYLTLEGNKLTLVIDEARSPYIENEEYVIIRIPTSPYSYDAPCFDEEIPQDVTLEIIVRQNHQPVYSNELTKQEWESAIDETIYAENYTKAHSISFVNYQNNISYASGTFKYTDNIFSELAYFYNYQNGQRTAHALYQDYANERYFEVENAKWTSKNGTILHDCIIPAVLLNEIKASFDNAVFHSYDGCYTIEQAGNYHNIFLQIANSRLVYLRYQVDYIPERERYNEYHQIYFYDYGTTEIELPKAGQGAPLSYLAEKRAQKVTIDLGMHSLYDEEEKIEENDSEFAGYIGINVNGNEYIAYAPNIYSYYVQIQANKLNYNTKEVTQLVSQIEKKYFDDEKTETKKIDAIWHTNNCLMLYFPDFDSYFECQEDLLDGLSKLDTVSSVKIGYIYMQNEHTRADEYSTVTAYGNSESFDNNCLFSSYSELEAELGSKLTTNTALQTITEQTFDDYYVFGINSYDYRNKISDARLVDGTVYVTINDYYKLYQLEDAIDRSCSFLVFVPKAELGELPENITVKTIRAYILDGE